MHEKEQKLQEIIESLSPLERKIIPFLNEKIDKIIKKTQLDEVSLHRALRFLENKNIIKLSFDSKTLIDLGTNGIYYKKHNLPERALLIILEKENHISLDEAKKLSKLSENEFKASLGVLKNKSLISLNNGKLAISASKEELMKKTSEEQFLHALPLEQEILTPEQKLAFESLKKRKNIVEVITKKILFFTLTQLGKELAGKELPDNTLEEITPELIQNWSKGKKFRAYNLTAQVPKVYGGKRHFVEQAVAYARRIWLDLGFQEMSGPLVDTSFWVFDVLFTPQDHQAREQQDTFFLQEAMGKLPDKNLLDKVKKTHESGIAGSKGWRYSWKEGEAKKIVLRTHTTSLSARTLALSPQKIPAKYFSIGKVFRNETLDWNHGFEFYQSEGIVVSKDSNFRHLLWYLEIFYKKMGFEKIRFRPSFFAYTEPSVEIEVFHPQKKLWIELGGAGIFRPEVTVPLLGHALPVLAWGQGFDRIIMDAYAIKDLRDMYSNNLKQLREKEVWLK